MKGKLKSVRDRHVAIVTGGAGDIGRATVDTLLKEDWNVVAVDFKDMAPLFHNHILLDQLHFVTCDLTSSDAPSMIVSSTLSRFGQLHLLVNNAGIGNAKPLDETDDATLEKFMAVNFASAFRLTRACLGKMKSGASIINISSVLAERGTPATAAYAATKAALVGLTRQMACEYGPRGIRTNAVAPGLIETQLTRERLESDVQFQRIWRDKTPWPRLGQPKDIANAIAFLASERAEFINGHTLTVDGGWSISGGT